MFANLRILKHQGKQYLPDPTCAEVPGPFRGVPEISSASADENALIDLCPTNAIRRDPFSIDLGRCMFCGECARAFPHKITFSKNYRMATNDRKRLIIYEGVVPEISLNPENVRKEIRGIFRGSLKLRQVSAGGDNSNELELNAAGNVNFDMGRYGIEFVASPRHADGVVITGPITVNMAEPLRICYEAIPDPRLIILAGTDAISGGLFEDSQGVNRSFLDDHQVDLYVPGNPVHPLTFINGILTLVRTRWQENKS